MLLLPSAQYCASVIRTSVAGRFHIIPGAKELGCGDSILVLDGAHTASSAKALASTLKMVFSSKSLAFVIAMAADKDHYEFCSQLLSGAIPKVVVATESLVAGGRFRSTPASLLAQTWNQAAKDQNLDVSHLHSKEKNENTSVPDSAIIITESESILSSIKKANQLLRVDSRGGVVCVTGSLHAVSEVLSFLQTEPSINA